MMNEFSRKVTRLADYDYTQAGGYFITMVAFQRERLFGEVVDGSMTLNDLGRIVEDCWEEIPMHFPQVTVDAFVVMPNHVHGILFIHEDVIGARVLAGATHGRGRSEISLVGATHGGGRGEIYLAPTRSTRPQGYARGSLGAIVANFKAAVTRRAGRELNSGNIWQRNFYEHILRNQTDYEQKSGYIIQNPEDWEGEEDF